MQLHCPGLAVWHQHSGLKRPLVSMHHQRQFVRLTQHSSSKCFSNAAEGGDVVRPNAQAASPAAPPALADVVPPGSSTGSHAPPPLSGSSSSTSSMRQAGSTGSRSANGSSSSSQGSYSEFYRAVNSSQYGLLPGGGQVPPTHTGSGGSGNGSGHAIQHQQQQQLPQHQQHHHHQQQQQAGGVPDHATAAAADAGNMGSSQPQHNDGAEGLQQQQQQQSTSDIAGVEDAIRKAQQALAAAESSLSSIHQLKSAQPPSKWAGVLQVLKSLATVAAAGALLVASHAFGLGWQWVGATLGALALAALAFKQQSVTEGGAVAAAAACLATFGCSLRFGLVLLAVSYSSCKLRQFKETRVVHDFSTALSSTAAQQQRQQQQQQEQQPRDWLEVAGVAAIPTILAIAYGAMAGCLDLPLGGMPNVETWRADLLTLLQGAVLGWYACICGDAWSSELGELSKDQPRLLSTLQPVRKGTHGGVTLLGLSGAAAGGLLVGAVFYCAAVLSPTLWVFEAQRTAAMAQWRVVPLGLMAGLFGSLLDSMLGATLQFTGYDLATSSVTHKPGPSVQHISGLQLPWLTDNIINVLAASVTAVLTALAALATFG